MTPRDGCWNGAAVVESEGADVANGTRANVTRPVMIDVARDRGIDRDRDGRGAGSSRPRLSVTTSEKVSAAAVTTAGAVKVGCEVAPFDSVTVGVPAVCVHA